MRIKLKNVRYNVTEGIFKKKRKLRTGSSPES